MYCVNGASRSSPLIESTDSMISLASQTYVARAEKRGGGTYVWCIFGQVFVHAAGMLAVPIRLQYPVININNT